jgi:hypothetical protein
MNDNFNENQDKILDYFKNSLKNEVFEIIFNKYDNENIMINHYDVKKITNCKKDILINILQNTKYNFIENHDYLILADKKIMLSVKTLRYICMMRNEQFRYYYLNLEKKYKHIEYDNKKSIEKKNIDDYINTIESLKIKKNSIDFFDNNSIDDYINNQVFYLLKINDNTYKYGST